MVSSARQRRALGDWPLVKLLFSERNYTLFLIGQIASNAGTWAQRIAQDWLVLDLSGNSGLALGFVVLLQSAPIMLFGLWGGRLADRYSKKKIMIVCNVVMLVVTVSVGLLEIGGNLHLWHIFVSAALLGMATAFDQPANSAYLIQLTGPQLLPVAVVFNVSAYELAAFLGPVGVGILVSKFGLGTMFLLNSASFGIMLVCVALIRVQALYEPEPEPEPEQPSVNWVKRRNALGVLYATQNLAVLLPISIVAITSSFGQGFQILLPLLVREKFDMGAAAYAMLMGGLAAGALIGAAIALTFRAVTTKFLLCSGCAFGLLLLVVAVAPSYLVLLVCLVPVGVAASLIAAAANSMVQLGTDPDMRGRVMALYMQVLLVSNSFGSVIYGASSGWLGSQANIMTGGVIVFVGCPIVVLLIAKVKRLRPKAVLQQADEAPLNRSTRTRLSEVSNEPCQQTYGGPSDRQQ